LVWEGYLDASKHGTWKLTEKGRNATITENDAHKIFLKWVAINQRNRKSNGTEAQLEEEFTEIINEVAPEQTGVIENLTLIDVLRTISPEGFEKLCRELLRESGFENVEITGGSADGGIDGYGTLEINPFVSFKVLFQCKY